MYFENANYAMGGNFEIRKAAPMDNRTTVAKLIHLSDSTIFNGFTYNGMRVSVVDDGPNNGLYILEDKDSFIWNKVGGSNITISQTTGTSTTEVMSQDAVTKELESKVSKDGDKQLSQENFTTSLLEKLQNLDNNFKGFYGDSAQRDDNVVNPLMGNYVMQPDGEGGTVVWFYNGDDWINTGSSSLGDMRASIYDPTGINKDAFSMDNMVETISKKILTSLERTKLEGIESGAQVNTISKVNNKTGDVVIDKNDIGLGKVDNTADIEKVVAEANKTRGELTLVVNGTETKFNGSENKTIQVEAGGSGGGSGDYNDLTNKPNFKTINNQFIIGSGNLDIKSELYNYGFNLKGIYSNIAELREDESNPIHKDTDIWMTKESLDFVFVNDEPVYIAPDGSDETGDGSYDNPYRTFTNIPKNSLIKLKAGQYKGSDYGYFSLSYGKVHGLFKGLMSGEATSDTRPNNPNIKEIPKDYKAKLVALSSAFTRMETFSVITKESDDAVVEIIDDVGTATEAKPWFRFYGATTDLWIFKDLKFIREVVLTSTNTNSAIALMESANLKALVVEDCVFECSGGRYGYNYSTSSYILLNRCRFENGTIAHHGPAVVLNNDSMDVYRDAINIVPTALYIYYANQSKFIPFNLPKTVDSNPYPVKFEGLSELPSPKVGVEVLTPYRCPVNGKPFYSKIIDCGFIPALANHYWEKDIGISNPETTIDFITPDYPNSFVHVPNIGAFSFGIPQTWHAVGHNISFYVDNYKIAIGTASATNNNKKLYCAIKYTKTADTVNSPVSLVGSAKRGLPGPKGQDGTVAFSDLTETQLEMLLENRNIVTRKSTDLLIQNLTTNSCLLDINSKMMLPEKIEVTTNEDVAYTIENLKLANPLVNIGDCKYTNISSDLQFDIFSDNSSLAVYPLQVNSNDLGGLYDGVDIKVTYDNNKAVFDGTAKITPTAFTIPEEMTVTFYVTFPALGSYMLFDFGGGKAIYTYQDNRIRVQYANANNAHRSTTSAVVVGKEYFVAAVIKASSADIYIDGELQVNTAWANYITSIGLCIGAKPNNTMFSKMNLSMLRVFNRSLTASEILHMYQNRNVETLELYHASGVNLKNSKIIQRTVSLDVPRYLNEAEAIKYGLAPGDMYYLTDGSVRFVK